LNLKEPAPLTIYLNAFQETRMIANQLSLRTAIPPAAATTAANRVVRDVLKNVPVAKVTTLERQVDASIVPERLIAMLASWFGGLGALLAALGLYGLMAFTVARRTGEIGVRMALGATTRDVVAMVLRSAFGLVLAGVAIGVPLAIATRRLLGSAIDGLRGGIAIPLLIAAAAMMLIALVASGIPARRAAAVRPVDALRHS
jgi:predicted lysophospholipase L1 biosynthesis ABC-type transport system permease subunit